MLVPPVYLLATVLRKQPLRLRSFELPLPSPAIAVGQALISAVEWTLAGAVLYVLLPPSGLSFLQFLGAFLIAILLGMASHVPGGVGVFEGLMVLLLKPYLTSGQLLPALVVYRVGVLPAAADRRARRARHRRSATAPRPRGAHQRRARSTDGAADAAGAGCLHVSRRAGVALLGRHARRRRTARAARSRPAVRADRSVALPEQRGRRRAADPVARAGAAPRCRLLPDGHHDRHRHGGVSAERIRLRGGGAAAAGLRWCCGGRGRPSIAAPPFSTRASPRRGLPR